MQTTKFSFELPNYEKDLIDIANLLMQKAIEIKLNMILNKLFSDRTFSVATAKLIDEFVKNETFDMVGVNSSNSNNIIQSMITN